MPRVRASMSLIIEIRILIKAPLAFSFGKFLRAFFPPSQTSETCCPSFWLWFTKNWLLFSVPGTVAVDITHTRSKSSSSDEDLWLQAQMRQYALYTPRPWYQHRHGPTANGCGTLSSTCANPLGSSAFYEDTQSIYTPHPHTENTLLPHVGVMTMLHPDRNFQRLHWWVQAWLAGWLTAVFLSTRSRPNQ